MYEGMRRQHENCGSCEIPDRKIKPYKAFLSLVDCRVSLWRAEVAHPFFLCAYFYGALLNAWAVGLAYGVK
jgi:hypothetical protein